MNVQGWICGFAVVYAWSAAASVAHAISIDGVKDFAYHISVVAVQDTPTGFGDNLSELNAAYAHRAVNGDLSLLLTGNLENNGNTIVLFIDSRAGGAVTTSLSGGFGMLGSIGGQFTDDWGTDIDGGDAIATPFNGASVLDPGFNPEMALTFSHSVNTYYMNVIDLTIPNDANQPDKDVYHDYANAPTGIAAAHVYVRTDENPAKGHGSTIQHALVNTNTSGVTDLVVGQPLSATTGLEIRLPATFLGNTDQPIGIMAFITNGSGDYLSNQFLGENGLDGSVNLAWAGFDGGDPLFDARLFPANQYFTVDYNGDYNADGYVNAADYVVWRNSNGSQAQYNAWRSHFGVGSGAGNEVSIGPAAPEPSPLCLAAIAVYFTERTARRIKRRPSSTKCRT